MKNDQRGKNKKIRNLSNLKFENLQARYFFWFESKEKFERLGGEKSSLQ